MNERRKNHEQNLQTWVVKKGKYNISKGNKFSHKQKNQDEKSSHTFKNKKDHKDQQNISNEGKEWKFDKKKLKCYNCQKYGHFARECWDGEGAKNKSKNQASLAYDDVSSNSDVVVQMAKPMQ